MKARITFRVETYIEGKSLPEIRSKFEAMDLPENCNFVELVSVEDALTYDDIMPEFEDTYDSADLDEIGAQD